MLKSLLGIFLITCHFVLPAVSQNYNPRLLEMNADEISRSLWAHVPISRETVIEKLDFIYNEQALSEKASKFLVIYQNRISQIVTASFLSFASQCKEIYETENIKTKVAVSMLFEKVSDKSFSYFKQLEKLKRTKDSTSYNSSSDLKYFGTADKSTPLDCFVSVK